MIIFQNENIIILLNSKYSEIEILSPEILPQWHQLIFSYSRLLMRRVGLDGNLPMTNRW